MADLRTMMMDAEQQARDIQREIEAHQAEIHRLTGIALINQGRLDVLRQLVAADTVPVEYVVEAAPREE